MAVVTVVHSATRRKEYSFGFSDSDLDSLYSRQPVIGRVVDNGAVLQFPAFFLMPQVSVPPTEDEDLQKLSEYLGSMLVPAILLRESSVTTRVQKNVATLVEPSSTDNLSFRPKSGSGVTPIYFLSIDTNQFPRPELEQVLLNREFPVYRFAKCLDPVTDYLGFVKFQKN